MQPHQRAPAVAASWHGATREIPAAGHGVCLPRRGHVLAVLASSPRRFGNPSCRVVAFAYCAGAAPRRHQRDAARCASGLWPSSPLPPLVRCALLCCGAELSASHQGNNGAPKNILSHHQCLLWQPHPKPNSPICLGME